MKYSDNFNRWRRKHEKRSSLFVAFSKCSLLDNSKIEYCQTKTQVQNLIIGFGEIDGGYVHGSRLSEIICNGSKAGVWAYCPEYNFIVIDDWLDLYEEKGICHIDPEHFLYSNWEMISDNERVCVHCDHIQHRKTEMVPRYSWAANTK